MVWGLISCRGPERLVWINEQPKTNLDANSYLEILEEHIIDNDEIDLDNSIFMQDGARCHTAKTILESLD